MRASTCFQWDLKLFLDGQGCRVREFALGFPPSNETSFVDN